MPNGVGIPALRLFLLTAFQSIATVCYAATLTVVNDTDGYVTISVDGAYGCNTAGHTKCTIPVSPGMHALRAQQANGQSTSTKAQIPAEGRTWTIYPVANECSRRARASEARIAAWNAKCVGAGSRRTPALYQQCDAERNAMRAEQQRILNECPH
ncbi:MAG TPA: hypothetical protein VHD34_07845 [Xanthobacteraceae bacterium]|nr:hypothetical protein [Xanthobacteraceae bacterium]